MPKSALRLAALVALAIGCGGRPVVLEQAPPPPPDDSARVRALATLVDLKRAVQEARRSVDATRFASELERCELLQITMDFQDPLIRDVTTDITRVCEVELPAAHLAGALTVLVDDPARCDELKLWGELYLLKATTDAPIRNDIERHREICDRGPDESDHVD